MIKCYMNDYQRFEWLPLSKLNKDLLSSKSRYGFETVQSIVQRSKFGYQLKKRKLTPGTEPHLTAMLNSTTKGLYLCSLRTFSGMNSHVIGIDCSNQRIYDCEEDHALNLTKENISYCCGENSGGVNEISLCFIIEKRPVKLHGTSKTNDD